MMEELVCAVLNNGVRIPAIGYSATWESTNDDTALRSALNSGYRFLDTEACSGNEAEIGGILQEYFHRNVPREELFVSSKIELFSQPVDEMMFCFCRTLHKFHLNKADLVLLCVGETTEDNNFICSLDEIPQKRLQNLLEAWKVMEYFVNKGWTRCIGLCNVSTSEVEAISTTSTIKPAVVQVQQEKLQTEPKLVQYCKQKNIHLVVHLHSDNITSQFPDNKQLKNKLTNQVVGRYFIEKSISVVIHEKDPGKIRQSFRMLDFGVSPEDARLLVSQRLVPSGL